MVIDITKLSIQFFECLRYKKMMFPLRKNTKKIVEEIARR